MNDLLKLHKTVGGNGLNKLTYREYLDEHFKLGELANVEIKDNKLKVSEILPSCVLHLEGNDYEDKSPNRTKLTHSSTNGFTVVEQGKIGKGYHYGLGSTAGLVGRLDPNIFYGDFTVDFYTKRVANTGGWGTYALSLSASTQSRYYFGVTGSGHGSFTNNIVTLGEHNNNSYNVNSGFSCSLNVWYHIAFVRRNGVVTIYVDGKSVWSGAKSFSGLTGEILVGRGEGTVVNEYLDQIRIHKEALWTGNFTPPTYEDTTISNDLNGHRISPPIELPKNIVSSKIDWEGEGKMSYTPITSNDCIDEDTLFYLKGDAIKDYSIYNRNIVNNNVDIIDDELFGKCLSMPQGSNKYLNVSIPIDFSTRDFTIDWWENVTANGDTFQANGVALNSTGGFIGLGNSTGNQRLLTYTDSSNSYRYSASFGNQPFNEWVHWAIVRKGTTCKVYLNGKLALTQTIPTLRPHTGDWCIGKYYPNAINQAVDTLNGKIANFRVSNKVIWDEEFTPVINIPVKTYTPVKKGESINSLPPTLVLKQEVKGEETISNVKLEMKYKPKKEYIRPSDLKEEEVEENSSVLYLYNLGDVCSNTTGGWTSLLSLPTSYWNGGCNKATLNTDHIRFYASGSRVVNTLGTTNKIDLTNYSTLYIEATGKAKSSTYGGIDFGVLTQLNEATGWKPVSINFSVNNTKQVYEIDISNITGTYYVGGVAGVDPSGTSEFLLHRVWLEK